MRDLICILKSCVRNHCTKWFKNLENNLNQTQFKIGEHILKEINERLNFLLNLCLEYLTF